MLSSFSDAANTHCFTAFTEQSERIGLPPKTCTSLTVPFALTSNRSFTVPPIPLLFNMEGYCTATIFNALRLKLLTSCATLHPAVAATSTTPASIPRIFFELFFIVFRPSHHAGQAAPSPGIPQDAVKNVQAPLHSPPYFPHHHQKLTTPISMKWSLLHPSKSFSTLPF